MFVESSIIWIDEVSNFSENALKICLAIMIFLPSISLSAIFQTFLGISLIFLASTSSNLPILSHLSLFDKIFPSSHKSNSSVRFILSLPWYIVVPFNFLFFFLIYDWTWIPKCFWFIFDWKYRSLPQNLHTPHWYQTPLWHEKFLSYTPFLVGLIILFYVWS